MPQKKSRKGVAPKNRKSKRKNTRQNGKKNSGNGSRAIYASGGRMETMPSINAMMKNLSLQAQSYRSMNSAQLAYRSSLFNPWSADRVKIPGFGGQSTASMSIKQVGQLTANNNGFAKVSLTPWQLASIVATTNDVTYSDTTTGVSVVALNGTAATTAFNSYRVVSASLQVWSSAPLLTNGGMYSLTRVIQANAITADSVRDHPSTRFFRSADSGEILYWPKDSASLELRSTVEGEANLATSLSALFSGLSPAQPITWRIVVNFEFTVKEAFTDSFPPTPSPVGDPLAVVFSSEAPAAFKCSGAGNLIDMKSRGFFYPSRMSQFENLIRKAYNIRINEPVVRGRYQNGLRILPPRGANPPGPRPGVDPRDFRPRPNGGPQMAFNGGVLRPVQNMNGDEDRRRRMAEAERELYEAQRLEAFAILRREDPAAWNDVQRAMRPEANRPNRPHYGGAPQVVEAEQVLAELILAGNQGDLPANADPVGDHFEEPVPRRGQPPVPVVLDREFRNPQGLVGQELLNARRDWYLDQLPVRH